jgi:hypothetical protein
MDGTDKEIEIKDSQEMLHVVERKPTECDFKITGRARVWKGLFGTIAMLSDEAPVKVTKDGIYIKVVDPAHVAMVEITTDIAAYEEWHVREEGEAGLDINTLARWLGDSKDDDLVTIETRDDMVYYTTPEIERFMLKVDVSGMSRPKLPSLNLSVAVTLPYKAVQRTIKLLGKSGTDHITIEANNTAMTIKAEDTGYRKNTKTFLFARKVYQRKDMVSFTILGKKPDSGNKEERTIEERSLFPLDYLEYPFKTGQHSPWAFFKGKQPLIDNIKLTIGTDYPIQINAEGTNIRFMYLLAPRIESE